MDEKVYDISQLIVGHLKGTLTHAQSGELESWLASSPQNRSLFEQLTSIGGLENELRNIGSVATAEARQNLVNSLFPATNQKPAHQIQRWYRRSWLAAAAILILVAAIYLIVHQSEKHNSKPITLQHTSLPPGRDGAILKLSDGTEVVLDSAGNGLVSRQQGASVVLKDGLLAYIPDNSINAEPVYNTMSTPKGRQFHLRLPDGTGVWLNAASSIRYPVAFHGTKREVSVTGEVYFEVAANVTLPFTVQVADKETIQVLGTSFNINAYVNEKTVHTTLLEGAISVSSGNNKIVLQPGQQAQLAGSLTVNRNADIDKVMAWKNGAFNFENANLQEVMRQLERWYDIEVVYEKGIPETYFMGEMSRGMYLKDVLISLEKTGVHFRMEGNRKLIVMP